MSSWFSFLAPPRYRSEPIRYRFGCHVPIFDNWLDFDYPPLRTDDVMIERDVIDKPDNGAPLKVVAVDLQEKSNRPAHRTDWYSGRELIVRRGQSFDVCVTFNLPYQPDHDVIALLFAIGKRPKPSKGTLVKAVMGDSNDSSDWSCAMTSSTNDQQQLVIRVNPPSDAVVGRYELFVQTSPDVASGGVHHRYKHSEKFVVLFNPWQPDDAVYVEDDASRFEYVMNETGRLYVGSSRRLMARPWYFGQFEAVCLEAALHLLQRSQLATQAHGNPTLVTRALSSLTNSVDNNGVLVGNWSGDFVGGRKPGSWNGSVEILKQFMDARRPVKFGQCWVFSGLLTTLCRTLGIPARSVTNFDSAHDTDSSLTIDQFIDPEGKPVSGMANDSVWNFHVWNEAWFKRPDLPEGYGGWQAIDSTPQEASEGMMRCGPAPVVAIRNGDVFLGYDAKFIFAEVNGDRVTWLMTQTDVKPIGVDRRAVGRHISTKAVGSTQREDVTHCYKYPEGSSEERSATRKAGLHSSQRNISRLYANPDVNDVTFSFDAEYEKNGDITITLTAASPEQRTLRLHVHCHAKYYTGTPGEELQHFKQEVQLQPGGETNRTTLTMKAADYLPKLDGDALVGVYCLANVLESGQLYTAADSVSIDLPDLVLQVPEVVEAGQTFTAEVIFENPLPVALSSIMLDVEGPGLINPVSMNLRALAAGEQLRQEVQLQLAVPGSREVIASVTSRQLAAITGVATVNVK